MRILDKLGETIRGPTPVLPAKGGTVLGMTRKGRKESIFFVRDDVHTLCIGATRSGKSRCVVLPSIGLLGLAGESIVVSDPKGELAQYTTPFLERMGYEVLTLDFRSPLKSVRYNFLQPVIDAVNRRDISHAIECTWDITESLVGESKGERIWNDGEKSVIAAAIMAVVYDNRERPQYQNMTNVYSFISEMCKPMQGGELPINKYMAALPDAHPAKALLGIAEVAPSRTRGSFFTAALTTLRLFTSPLIYGMTCKSDFDPATTGIDKRAVFIILPDDKTTYYSLASLFVSQLYTLMVKVADARGGRLARRVNLLLDEFGNFTTIPAFTTKLTVGGGRGIRFNLFVQSLAQLDEKYGREGSKTIRGNCETWIYLQADDMETLEEISKKLGTYTVSAPSKNSSFTTNSTTSGSSASLTSRPLLTPGEVRMIGRPFSLITSRNYPAMLRAPDLTQWTFNRMFGMGNQEHNRRLREEREAERPIRAADEAIQLWGIWNLFHGAAQAASRRFPHERMDDD